MKLIVAYLATPGGDDALALGVRLARTLEADLEVCMILPPDRSAPAALPVGGYDDALAQLAEEWLAAAIASIPDDVTAGSHVCFHDSFAGGLIHEVERLGAAAIVVGGSGGSLAGSYTLGSVVNELLHSAPVPVAVAPRGVRNSSVDRVRTVTCAIGTRPGAGLLLDTAVRASSAAGTPLRLVSLVTLDSQHGGRRRHDSPESARARALAHAHEVLDSARRMLPDSVPVTSSITDGPTVESAVRKLDWTDGDLIMVGSSRLAQPRRLFLGSTAAKMLRVLESPMVIVPETSP